MKLHITLHAPSAQRRPMLWRLSMIGLNQHLSKHLFYVLTEFCNFEFPTGPCWYYLTDEETHRIVAHLEYFVKYFEPKPHRKPHGEALDSPTRPYTEEDLELTVVCLEWFRIGLKHDARVLIEYV